MAKTASADAEDYEHDAGVRSNVEDQHDCGQQLDAQPHLWIDPHAVVDQAEDENHGRGDEKAPLQVISHQPGRVDPEENPHPTQRHRRPVVRLQCRVVGAIDIADLGPQPDCEETPGQADDTGNYQGRQTRISELSPAWTWIRSVSLKPIFR